MVCNKKINYLFEPLNPTQINFILNDTNEINEDKLKHNERLIQEWISCQSHFPTNIDPFYIRSTLRGSKHILEKTKKKIENYLSAKHLYPEYFENRSPFAADIKNAMDMINIAVMPKLTPTGCRIAVFSLNRSNPTGFNVTNALKLFFMYYDLLLSFDQLFAGDIWIFDAGNLSAGHLAQFFGSAFKIIGTLPKEMYAIRLKAMHFVNAPNSLVKMAHLIKKVSHPKVKNSIYVYKNTDNIVENIGAEFLPSDYGGNLKSLRKFALDWYEALNDNAEWFNEQNSVKISSIPSQIKSKLIFDEQLGVEGSFRKLNID